MRKINQEYEDNITYDWNKACNAIANNKSARNRGTGIFRETKGRVKDAVGVKYGML